MGKIRKNKKNMQNIKYKKKRTPYIYKVYALYGE